jgi:hypothetical protein
MSGLVLELQSDALKRNIAVSDLLRKALVVSKKLGVTHIQEWLNNELNGYGPESVIPPYREIRGQMKVFNPYHGWQPLNFEDVEMAEKLCISPIMQPIGELDALTVGGSGHLQVPFRQDIVNALIAQMSFPLQPSLHIPQSEVIGLLDAVRNIILDFSLQLEQEGILGEGMSFSKEERQTASQITYNVTNNIGSMQHSQIQQHSSGTQTLKSGNDLQIIGDFIEKLRLSIDNLGFEQDLKEELLSEMITVESQTKSPRPKQPIITESLKTIRNILEGASGSIIASGLLVEMGKFF